MTWRGIYLIGSFYGVMSIKDVYIVIPINYSISLTNEKIEEK